MGRQHGDKLHTFGVLLHPLFLPGEVVVLRSVVTVSGEKSENSVRGLTRGKACDVW